VSAYGLYYLWPSVPFFFAVSQSLLAIKLLFFLGEAFQGNTHCQGLNQIAQLILMTQKVLSLQNITQSLSTSR